MKVDNKHYHSIWREASGDVSFIDQAQLPHSFEIKTLSTLAQAATAIEQMNVRGAPCIGATAAFGVAFAMQEDPSDPNLGAAIDRLKQTRPTAVNLFWALEQMRTALESIAPAARAEAAFKQAEVICMDDIKTCKRIGEHGLSLIREVAEKKDRVNVLTHCNAGALACVDWGTALAPLYLAHEAGIDIHVWVDETRPRNQGAFLTAWELGAAGIPHTVITDNAGGHLMQQGLVDLCIVGADRTTRGGDVANKIGTYLKALAAMDNHVPFYVAFPFSTIDWDIRDSTQIIIEEREASEVTHVRGLTARGQLETVCITAPGSPAANYGFDITPARLITGLITERGITHASETGLLKLYPERAHAN